MSAIVCTVILVLNHVYRVNYSGSRRREQNTIHQSIHAPRIESLKVLGRKTSRPSHMNLRPTERLDFWKDKWSQEQQVNTPSLTPV